jgi:Tol biopolymer transport system component
VTNTQESDEKMEGSSNEPQRSGSGQKGLLAMAAVVAILAIATGVIFLKRHTTAKGFDVNAMRVERMTRSGKAAAVAISPDGKSIVYVLRSGGEQSVMLQQDGAAGETQLIAPDNINYGGLAFSPDGSFLYYTASSKENHLYSALFKMPVHGGAPAKLVDDIDTAVSFSPDGTQFAFERGVPDKREVDLMIANADGSGVKAVAKKAGQVYSASLIAPAWSPDGATIVFTIYQATNRRTLMAVAPDGTGLREFYRTHDDLGRPQWLPDGSAIIVPVREGKLGDRGQLWKVDFASGQAERISNDQRDYNALWFELNRDATELAAVETTITGDLWLLPNGNSENARQVTTDGTLVIYVSNFGKNKIIFENREGRVYTADLDGGNVKQVNMGNAGLREVAACGDGKHIVYSETSGETPQIWRVDADGSHAMQITNGKSATMPHCSPDGQWIIFWNEEDHAFFRVSIDGGSVSKTDLANPSDPYVQFSPDGKSITYTSETMRNPQSPYNVVIAPSNGGPATSTFPMVPGMGMAPPQFSPDGHGLCFNLMRQGASNIWKMEKPNGELKQMTNFSSGLIASYAWSEDGKTLYVARATRSSDVVVLKSPK